MMILKFIKYSISLVFIGLIIISCQSDYSKLAEAELAKGVRKDSVLLGIKLGDTRNDFYGRCFDLNQQQLVMQGEGGSAQYIFVDSLFHDKPTAIKILFVPSFDEKDKMTNMDLKFSYAVISPLNQDTQIDTLRAKVMDILMDWYGGNEFVMFDFDDKRIPVKVDGNRRLLVIKFDTQNVVVRVQDLLHPKFSKLVKDKISKEEK